MANCFNPVRINDMPHEILTQASLPWLYSPSSRLTMQIFTDDLHDEIHHLCRQRLRVLRQVNRRFYWTATRLLYRNIAITVDTHTGDETWIRPGLMSLLDSNNRAFVQVIKINDKEYASGRSDEMMAKIYEELPLVLARFPNLRHLTVNFVGSRMCWPTKDDPPAMAVAAITKFLQFHAPENLQALNMCAFEVPLPWKINYIDFNDVMERLQEFTFESVCHQAANPQPELIQALRRGKSLRRVELAGVRFDLDGCSNLVHPNAPLQHLWMQWSALPASWLASMVNHKETLKGMHLNNIKLTEGNWAVVFQQFRSGFNSLTWFTSMDFPEGTCKILYDQFCEHMEETRKRLGYYEKESTDYVWAAYRQSRGWIYLK
ncbi:hypothetical protein BJX99DRAFT_261248 [Aspergillus californicus]